MKSHTRSRPPREPYVQYSLEYNTTQFLEHSESSVSASRDEAVVELPTASYARSTTYSIKTLRE